MEGEDSYLGSKGGKTQVIVGDADGHQGMAVTGDGEGRAVCCVQGAGLFLGSSMGLGAGEGPSLLWASVSQCPAGALG